jgi:hypothetical protein
MAEAAFAIHFIAVIEGRDELLGEIEKCSPSCKPT